MTTDPAKDAIEALENLVSFLENDCQRNRAARHIRELREALTRMEQGPGEVEERLRKALKEAAEEMQPHLEKDLMDAYQRGVEAAVQTLNEQGLLHPQPPKEPNSGGVGALRAKELEEAGMKMFEGFCKSHDTNPPPIKWTVPYGVLMEFYAVLRPTHKAEMEEVRRMMQERSDTAALSEDGNG